MSEWDGKTKGSLAGYKFFVSSISFFGLSFTYFLSNFVSFYFLLFGRSARSGLISFYKKSFSVSGFRAFGMARRTFYNFGVSLIDRFAMVTKRKKKFTFDFKNESVLKEMADGGKGGILISAHLGNWEVAGNLIHDRVSGCINIVALDNEVEKIKSFLELKTGGPKYNVIPIKGDLSHLILIKQALDRNELIAIHADRTMKSGKSVEMDFFSHKANFPLGPFILASKFKTPVTFVFAVKTGKYHYSLSATETLNEDAAPETLLNAYVKCLEEKVETYPDQWYNFYNYYVD